MLLRDVVCLCAGGRLLFHLDPVVNTDITAVDEELKKSLSAF